MRTRATARAALLSVLARVKPTVLALPAYTCPHFAHGMATGGVPLIHYSVGRRLDGGAAFVAGLPARAAIVVNCLFGRPVPLDLRACLAARPDLFVVEDRAQALDAGPPWADVTLYSPRKVVGVADGGLAIGRELDDDAGTMRSDIVERMAPSVWRLEDRDHAAASHWYPLYKSQEERPLDPDAAMLASSLMFLDRVEIAPMVARRKANWRVLHGHFADRSLWPEESDPAFAPLGYPLFCDDPRAVQGILAADGIFCARHYEGLVAPAGDFDVEHEVSARLLTLPCDHRYGENDMIGLANAVRSALVRSGSR